MSRKHLRKNDLRLYHLFWKPVPKFHHMGEDVNTIARKIVRELGDRGIRAMNPAMEFPMEAQDYLDVSKNVWIVSHKPIAVAAGLGRIGIHRNVIHPKFGNFILLGTVLADSATKLLALVSRLPNRLETAQVLRAQE